MTSQPKLLLVDDHRLLAETLQASLALAGVGAVAAPCGDYIGPLRDHGAEVVVLTGTTDRIELARCLEAAGGESVKPPGERMQLLSELDDHRRTDQPRWVMFERLRERKGPSR